MYGGYCDGIAETERIELVERGILRAGGVGLVDGEDDGLARAQQHIRHVLVRCGNAGTDVGDEDDNVRRVYRYLRLLAHEQQYLAVGHRLDAAGIDYIKFSAAPLALGVEPVARDAGRVLDYREALSDKAVEEHGLADVRPAHYCNKRSCHIFPSYLYIYFINSDCICNNLCPRRVRGASPRAARPPSHPTARSRPARWGISALPARARPPQA